MANSIKTGDKVLVLSGDNKGKTAKVVKMDRKNNKAMLENIGIITRHLKRTAYNPAGGKKSIHTGIDCSNLKKVEGDK